MTCLLTDGFKLGITCSVRMIHWRRNMSELYMQHSNVNSSVHVVGTVNWLQRSEQCTEWTLKHALKFTRHDCFTRRTMLFLNVLVYSIWRLKLRHDVYLRHTANVEATRRYTRCPTVTKETLHMWWLNASDSCPLVRIQAVVSFFSPLR
jgi:hypothetical protein